MTRGNRRRNSLHTARAVAVVWVLATIIGAMTGASETQLATQILSANMWLVCATLLRGLAR